jgi:hypothetical protein
LDKYTPLAYPNSVDVIRTRRFMKDMQRMGASARDMERLMHAIAQNPQAGDVVPGLDGLRKLRFALGNKGKRGGGRAIYVLIMARDTAFMIFAYSKAEQADLTADQRKTALALIKELTDGDA